MSINRAPRIEFSERVLLELDKNRGFIGYTENISESGVFVLIGYPPFQVSIGEPGFLHLMPIRKRQPFFFRIRRITDYGIAVHFLGDPSTSFKTCITSDGKNLTIL